MNSTGSRLVKFNSLALALFATLMLIPGGASAQDQKANRSDNHARVVAPISFTALSAIDMAMPNKGNDKVYLYGQHSQFQGISMIDISKPAEPKALRLIPWPDPAMSSRMKVTGDLAIIAETSVLPTGGGTSNDNLVVWDLSNPAAPPVVQEFSGVVQRVQDDRNFTYVLNHQGPGVISKPADGQPEQTESTNNHGG